MRPPEPRAEKSISTPACVAGAAANASQVIYPAAYVVVIEYNSPVINGRSPSALVLCVLRHCGNYPDGPSEKKYISPYDRTSYHKRKGANFRGH